MQKNTYFSVDHCLSSQATFKNLSLDGRFNDIIKGDITAVY